MYRQGPGYGPPGSFQPRTMTGVCHFCQLPGNYARDCPAQRPFPPPFSMLGIVPVIGTDPFMRCLALTCFSQ